MNLSQLMPNDIFEYCNYKRFVSSPNILVSVPASNHD